MQTRPVTSEERERIIVAKFFNAIVIGTKNGLLTEKELRKTSDCRYFGRVKGLVESERQIKSQIAPSIDGIEPTKLELVEAAKKTKKQILDPYTSVFTIVKTIEELTLLLLLSRGKHDMESIFIEANLDLSLPQGADFLRLMSDFSLHMQTRDLSVRPKNVSDFFYAIGVIEELKGNFHNAGFAYATAVTQDIANPFSYEPDVNFYLGLALTDRNLRVRLTSRFDVEKDQIGATIGETFLRLAIKSEHIANAEKIALAIFEREQALI